MQNEMVGFCNRCVVSNQRPTSSIEHERVPGYKLRTIDFEGGVCSACRYAEQKNNIDWEQREQELIRLLDKHRKNDGSYDCLVPGSGGKDSGYAAHVLKYKYNMNPLTCTWPPILYTDYGRKNYDNWVGVGGFDNVCFKQNGKAMKLLTRLSIQNMLHPFQTFILGQKNFPPKVALRYNIPLVFYGESEAEYCNPLAETETSLRHKSYFTMRSLDKIYLGGVSINRLVNEYGLRLSDIMSFLPPHEDEIRSKKIEVHYLGYYLKWTPQEAYYYAVENTGFQARPFRTDGTYSKYNSIDDKIDDLHYYTAFIKFGVGRCTHDASQEIRNNHITRDEGVALVHKFDGEYPTRYIDEVLDYIGMDRRSFNDLCDRFRSPHLWEKGNGAWQLRYQVK